jgi:hypothetical protein
MSFFEQFQSNKYLSGTKEFLESNSIVAKFTFLLIMVIVFILLLRLGISILHWVFSTNPNPILLDGLIDAKQMIVIPQNPSVPNAVPINRSFNEQGGIEFTWSVWIYIDDITYREGNYRHIFHKGDDNIAIDGENKGMNYPNNGPGLYIDKDSNKLVVVMNTFNNIIEKVFIPNIPIKKWVNVILRTNSNNLDIFINGVLTRRHVFQSVPKQNFGDVFISMNGGFGGSTSSLRYFNYAIGTSKIQSILSDGPNLKVSSSVGLSNTKPPGYLSMRWYLMNN